MQSRLHTFRTLPPTSRLPTRFLALTRRALSCNHKTRRMYRRMLLQSKVWPRQRRQRERLQT